MPAELEALRLEKLQSHEQLQEAMKVSVETEIDFVNSGVEIMWNEMRIDSSVISEFKKKKSVLCRTSAADCKITPKVLITFSTSCNCQYARPGHGAVSKKI